MLIRFFHSLQKLAEQEAVLVLSKPITVQEFLGILSDKYPSLAPLIQKNDKSEFFTPIIFLRNSQPLKLTDVIETEDTVIAVLPAVGG